MRFLISLLFLWFGIINTAVAETPKHVLDIQHWTTTNGAHVYFVPISTLPIVDIQLVFAAGSARDDTHWGLAQLTNSLLKQGTTTQTATQLAERIEQTGAVINTDTELDSASVAFRSLTDPNALYPALRVLTDILTHPNFPPVEFSHQVQQALNAIKQTAQSPSYRADQAFFAALYGQHPYAHPILGDVAHVRALTRENVLDFYHRYYVAKNATLAIVGSLDRKNAERIAEQILHALPAGTPAAALPLPSPITHVQARQIPFPAHQTHLRLGQLGVRLQDPDYFALRVGNHILGGDELISRLATEIRETNGLAYHVSSHFMPLKAGGPFIVALQTQSQQAPQALTLTQSILKQFISAGPTAAELAAAQRDITAGFLLRLKNNAAITQNIAFIGFYNLPLDYLDTYRDKINRITREQVHTAFQQHMHLNTFTTVEVGQLPTNTHSQ